MATTIDNFYKRVAYKIGQYWATASLWGEAFFSLLKDWLDEIYMYNGRPWSWQLRKQAFTQLTPNNDWVIKLRTNYPIIYIHGFFCWPMPANDVNGAWLCDCPTPELNPCVAETSDCWCQWSDCKALDMIEKQAQSALCQGEYQISWWDFNWGLFWNIITLKLPCNISCEQCIWLYVEYYAWYPQLLCNNDILPIPRQYEWILSNFMASYAVSPLWVYRQWDDNWYRTIATAQLKNLEIMDSRIRTKIVWPDIYKSASVRDEKREQFYIQKNRI